MPQELHADFEWVHDEMWRKARPRKQRDKAPHLSSRSLPRLPCDIPRMRLRLTVRELCIAAIVLVMILLTLQFEFTFRFAHLSGTVSRALVRIGLASGSVHEDGDLEHPEMDELVASHLSANSRAAHRKFPPHSTKVRWVSDNAPKTRIVSHAPGTQHLWPYNHRN